MKITSAVGVVWRLAMQDAASSRFKEIEPEHFLAGLMTFAGLQDDDVGRLGLESGNADQLVAERDAVRALLAERLLEAEEVRRRLKERLGAGGGAVEAREMHRSPASRQMFDAAQAIAEGARSEAMMARHLFHALVSLPTPLIADLLGKTGEAPPADGSALREHAKDLTGLVAGCAAMADPGSEAAVRVLIRALSRRERTCVILVGEDAELATNVVLSTAQRLARGSMPLQARKIRIYEILAPRLLDRDAAGASRRLADLLAAGERRGNVVFYLQQREPSLLGGGETRKVLLRHLKGMRAAQCILSLPEEAYRRHLEAPRALKGSSMVVWLQPPAGPDLPDRL